MQQPPPYRSDTMQETLPKPRRVYPMPLKRDSHTSATMYYFITNKRKFIRALRNRQAHLGTQFALGETMCTTIAEWLETGHVDKIEQTTPIDSILESTCRKQSDGDTCSQENCHGHG